MSDDQRFDWDDGNLDHLTDCDPDEAQEAILTRNGYQPLHTILKGNEDGRALEQPKILAQSFLSFSHIETGRFESLHAGMLLQGKDVVIGERQIDDG